MNKLVRCLLSLCLLASFESFALPFGQFYARTQGLGGTATAIASHDHAQFYNPSLLAFSEEDEDKTLNGRFFFPSVTATASRSAIDAIELIDDELDQRFSDAIDAYNANPNAPLDPANPSITTTTAALDAGREIENLAERLINQDLEADIYTGFSVSEIGELGGGAFYLGTRVVGGGVTNVPEDDQDIFDRYVEALEFLSEQDTNCANNPQTDLFRDPFGSPQNCAFVDPLENVESNAIFRGAIVTEAGVSFAWQQSLSDDLILAYGATPKVALLQTFDEIREVSARENFDIDTSFEPHIYFNTDLGLTLSYKTRYRIALVSKNVLKKSYLSELNNRIRVTPSTRLGLGYLSNYGIVGLDIDLRSSDSFAGEQVRQNVSLGYESQFSKRFLLRAGYIYDLKNNYDSQLSFGLGLSLHRFIVNLSYLRGENQRGVSLQSGFTF